MKKLNILYKNNDAMLIDNLPIYINGKEMGEIKKNKVKTIELEPGEYEVKISYAKIKTVDSNGASLGQEILVQEKVKIEDNDVYCTITLPPLPLKKKSKLDKMSKEEFDKKLKKNGFWSSKKGTFLKLGIIVFIYIIFMIIDAIYN